MQPQLFEEDEGEDGVGPQSGEGWHKPFEEGQGSLSCCVHD